MKEPLVPPTLSTRFPHETYNRANILLSDQYYGKADHLVEENKKIVSYILLVALIIIWGVSWPIYKYGVQFMPPLTFAGVRAFIGGIILLFLARNRLHLLHFQKYWPFYIISAMLNMVLYLGLQTVGIVYLPGGMFSVLVYFQPVLLGILAWLILKENMTVVKLFGLVVGFIGILLVSIEGITVHLSLIGVVLAIATALAWALGVVYVKKHKNEVDLFLTIVMQLVIGGSVLLFGGFVMEDLSGIHWTKGLIYTIIWGSIFGMAVAQVLYFKLMNEGEASKVGAFTFLVPIVAVIVSSIFLNEAITINLFFGMTLVGVSIFMVNYQKKYLRIEND